MWTTELFGRSKPIIGMLHLHALPGDPAWVGSMRDVIAAARADLAALINGGVDGILISNEFSLPYQRQVDMVTPIAMARVIGECRDLLNIPYGVDCISDASATLELAAAVDASFVRGTFSGVYAGDGGLYDNSMARLQRRRAALGLQQLRMIYFLNPESDWNLDRRSLSEIAASLQSKVAPDALCVSARAAGCAVEDEVLAVIKRQSRDICLLVNTGCTKENIAVKLAQSDGAIVGTTFKNNGEFWGNVEEQRVRDFMTVARQSQKEA